MTLKKPENPAFVLGMFETGLGVARSLGVSGIKVYGLDHKKDIGFYSRYIKPVKCPHPVHEPAGFIDFLVDKAKTETFKPVLFITSDDFLRVVSENRTQLADYFYFNFPSAGLLSQISDKYKQYLLAKQAGIAVPYTVIFDDSVHERTMLENMRFPVIVKAKDVTVWRKKISAVQKGFLATSMDEIIPLMEKMKEKRVEAIIQEVISGPDTNHFKFCGYYDNQSRLMAGFTLQKIRQNPVHFGVGSVVESIDYPQLFETGDTLFRNIGYCGIGSAEFKLDNYDNKLKLVEINPRYWQQNYLSKACGINFPYIDYCYSAAKTASSQHQFKKNIKWVNIYLDFESFLKYRKEGELSWRKWLTSLKGKKVWSDFNLRDPLPGFYEIRFGLRLLKIFRFLKKNIHFTITGSICFTHNIIFHYLK